MPITSELQIFSTASQGGLVLDRDVLTIPPSAAKALQNYEPDVKGGYRRISGFSKYSTSALAGSGEVLGIAVLGDSVIGCRGANVQKGTGGSWSSINTGRTSAKKYIFDKFNWSGTEKVIMADSTNKAATFDGSSYVLIETSGAPASPSYVQEFKDHMFYVQGNELIFTAPFQETNFDVADGAGSITFTEGVLAAKSHRDALYIFTPKSVFKLTGTNQADWRLEPVTREIGCVSKFSIQEIAGDIVFLANDGLRTIASTDKIGDTELGTISKQIQSIVDHIADTASADNISSLVIRGKTQYRLFFHEDAIDELNAKGIIAVLKRQVNPQQIDLSGNAAWEYAETKGIKPSYSTNDLIGVSSVVPIELHGDKVNGLIYKQEDGDTFNGVAIESVFTSPDLVLDDIGVRDTLQRLILDVENSAPVVINIGTVIDVNALDTPQPLSFNISLPGTFNGSTYGTGVYGTARYASVTFTINRAPLIGSGFTVSIKIIEEGSTTEPFTIKGFSIEYTPGGRR
tara:strand:+ start:1622 stop:3166 length:1545 start_codon:yes stop_codon:yes gene_type:complete